jgi:colicin import membrane protein
MSTIPERRTSSNARTNGNQRTKKSPASFDYGYRYVRKKLPDGRYDWVQRPLTLDDVLHPREGDVHMLGDPHADDCTYLRVVGKAKYANDPSVAVFSDCGIYWDIPGLKHHSPDFCVIFGVKKQKRWETFRVKTEKVRPSLIIEVTSPSTRILDIKTKVEQYAMAKVPYYVIADVQNDEEDGERRRISLISYRLRGLAYKRVKADELGRVWLDPLNLWLGVQVDPVTGGDRLVLIDPATNVGIGDYTQINRARLEAEASARVQADRADEAEASARVQADRADEAEASARIQADRADAEAQARAQAEARALAAETRLRELEAAMKRRKPRK